MYQSVAFNSSEMRVLVAFALFAYAAARPSGLLNPLQYTGFPFVPVSPYGSFPIAPVAHVVPYAALSVAPVVAPEVPAGDIQAAAINAQVKAADQARSLADQARELAEQAAENINEGVAEANDLGKEKSGEAFWAAEENKWQALNEAQIAEARAASAAASSEVAPEIQTAELIPEVAQAKSSETTEVKTEEKPEAKAAEPEKPAEELKEAEKKDDTVEVKAAAPEDSKPEDPFAAYKSPIVAVAPGFNFQPYISPVSYQSSYRSSFPIGAVQPFAAFPNVYQPGAFAVKHAW